MSLDSTKTELTCSTAWKVLVPPKIWVLAMLTAIHAVAYADRNVINLLLDSIKAEFHLSDTILGLITGFGFTLFQLVFVIPFARLADNGRRTSLLGFGLLLWSLMTGVSGFVTSAIMLAAARMGVGVGEACLSAPAQSLLSDYFDKHQRPRAFAIMSAGADAGIVLGLVIGGWFAHLYGWRAAFMVAGAPGIVLAAIFALTVSEPLRNAHSPATVRPAFRNAVRFLVGQRSATWMIAGGAVMGIYIYTLQVWSPTFLRRVHHMTMLDVGLYIGLVRAFAAILGAVMGGIVTEHMARHDDVWRVRVPAIACLMACPAALLFLFAPSPALAFVGLGLSAMMIGIHLGPLFAACQSVVPGRIRGLTAGIFIFSTQITGLGVGSLVVGMLSDHLNPRYGDLAIRFALIAPALCSLGAGALLWLAASSLSKDMTAAQTQDAGWS